MVGHSINAFIGGYRDIPGLFTETTSEPSWDRKVCSLLPATCYTHAVFDTIYMVCKCVCEKERERKREIWEGEKRRNRNTDNYRSYDPEFVSKHKDAWRSPCSREISFGFHKEYYTKRV